MGSGKERTQESNTGRLARELREEWRIHPGIRNQCLYCRT
jgi:hypothetical protein